MKRKLVTILIGCMTLGLFGCGSGLSDTTKRLTPQQMVARKRPSVTDTASLP